MDIRVNAAPNMKEQDQRKFIEQLQSEVLDEEQSGPKRGTLDKEGLMRLKEYLQKNSKGVKAK